MPSPIRAPSRWREFRPCLAGPDPSGITMSRGRVVAHVCVLTGAPDRGIPDPDARDGRCSVLNGRRPPGTAAAGLQGSFRPSSIAAMDGVVGHSVRDLGFGYGLRHRGGRPDARRRRGARATWWSMVWAPAACRRTGPIASMPRVCRCRVYSPLGPLGLLLPRRWRQLHHKICVVDGHLLFCGGILMCWTISTTPTTAAWCAAF